MNLWSTKHHIICEAQSISPRELRMSRLAGKAQLTYLETFVQFWIWHHQHTWNKKKYIYFKYFCFSLQVQIKRSSGHSHCQYQVNGFLNWGLGIEQTKCFWYNTYRRSLNKLRWSVLACNSHSWITTLN